MTRSEPPADVIEGLIDALNAAAGCNDLSGVTDDLLFSHARNQLQSVEIICRDAIEAYEKATSLRTSSSLGGIEGGVARAEDSAPHPDEPLITGKLHWQTMAGPMGYLIKPPHSAGEEDWYLSDDPVDGAESLPLYAFTPTATGLLAALEKIADEQKVYLGHGDYDIRPALTDFEAQNVARAAITAHQKVTGVDPSIRSEPQISSPAGALPAEKAVMIEALTRYRDAVETLLTLPEEGMRDLVISRLADAHIAAGKILDPTRMEKNRG